MYVAMYILLFAYPKRKSPLLESSPPSFQTPLTLLSFPLSQNLSEKHLPPLCSNSFSLKKIPHGSTLDHLLPAGDAPLSNRMHPFCISSHRCRLLIAHQKAPSDSMAANYKTPCGLLGLWHLARQAAWKCMKPSPKMGVYSILLR